MAATSRQPFAPLEGARLQSLTSMKNRLNAFAPSKRKANILEPVDLENVDPLLSAKRVKNSSATLCEDSLESDSSLIFPEAFLGTPSATVRALVSPDKADAVPRRVLRPKLPNAKPKTNTTKSSPLTAPAGRSPIQGKRAGILASRRRTAGPYTRVDSPLFSLDSAVPFSLDEALKGTISSYGSCPRSNALSSGSISLPLDEPDMKASWFFDIHEDSPEQEMTNLLQHSTCVLDISSDEESEWKSTRDIIEGRDKENVPPFSCVHPACRRPAPRAIGETLMGKKRVALGEMNIVDFYAAGCDENTVIIIPDDDEKLSSSVVSKPPVVKFTPKVRTGDLFEKADRTTASRGRSSTSKGSILQPIAGSGEDFELWESDSAKDDDEVIVTKS